MMKKKINFEFQGTKYKVEVERQGDNLVISKEGKDYTVTLLEGEKKALRPKPQAAVAVAPAAAPAAVTPTAGAGDVVAPMTGTVKEVKVAKGDAVAVNQLVVIMEAMKMDIEIFAESAGTVAEVYLAPGSSVKENQPIVKLA
jgi:glutaconyl-CoA/methylmalonyl-CoA decarboxylase subunit gamma